jgi:hypothetical protein
MNWQPIETAPKDGTTYIGGRLLCWVTLPGRDDMVPEYFVMDARWQDGRHRFRSATSGNPSHWMPLEPIPHGPPA